MGKRDEFYTGVTFIDPVTGEEIPSFRHKVRFNKDGTLTTLSVEQFLSPEESDRRTTAMLIGAEKRLSDGLFTFTDKLKV